MSASRRRGAKAEEMTPERAKEILRRVNHVSEAPEPPDVSDRIDWAKIPKPEGGGAPDLTNRQSLFLLGMARGMTIAEAAKYANLSYYYARKLAANADFRVALSDILEEMKKDALRDIASIRGLAIRRARDLLIDPTTPSAVVVTTIGMVLDRTGLPARVEVGSEVTVHQPGSGEVDLDAINGALSALDAPDTSPA